MLINRFATPFLAAVFVAIGFSRAAATNIAACGTFGAGSYTVINNISSAGINCLIFNAGPVTLDLGGFTVSGSGNSNGVVANGIANVTVRNGTFMGFARGIFATGTGTFIDGVRAVTGAVNGFTVGDNGTVENSLITGHNADGILAGKNANHSWEYYFGHCRRNDSRVDRELRQGQRHNSEHGGRYLPRNPSRF